MNAVSKVISVKHGSVPRLGEFLAAHPFVESISGGGDVALEFIQDAKLRRVWFGNSRVSLSGLVETMDNNPLVCAEEMSVPSPEGTLALIALAPLIRAGSLQDTPSLAFNFKADPESVRDFLATEGFEDDVQISELGGATGSVLTCEAHVALSLPLSRSELDEMYAEWYGKAFFLRRHERAEWNPHAIQATPFAMYNLSVNADRCEVFVAADRDGKCGAAQIIHAMNVMAGFEESLGIPSAF